MHIQLQRPVRHQTLSSHHVVYKRKVFDPISYFASFPATGKSLFLEMRGPFCGCVFILEALLFGIYTRALMFGNSQIEVLLQCLASIPFTLAANAQRRHGLDVRRFCPSFVAHAPLGNAQGPHSLVRPSELEGP